MTQSADMPELRDPEIFRNLLDTLSTGFCLLGRGNDIVLWNKAAEAMTGYQRHEAVGNLRSKNILIQCNDVECLHCGAACPFTESRHEGKPVEMQAYIHHKEGHVIPVHLRVTPIRNQHGSVVATGVTFDEDRSASQVDVAIHSLATHGCLDLTTGVPNHAFTQSHLRENLAFFEEYRLPFGILRIRAENLDAVKATHGREAVDVMLHMLAQTAKHTLRPDGFLGRWTEDHFLAIVTNCEIPDLQRAAQNVKKMADCSGIQWWDDKLSVTVSVGNTMVQPGDTMDILLERAMPSSKLSPVSAGAVHSSPAQEHPES
jgi:diguanylate cyclase (GGDEF)-like protein/PAS domain S-box-containing protein